jgi:hypothetical protein
MTRLAIVLMLAALASPVLAGQNPDIAIFLNTQESGEGTNEICPAPGEIFDVYVCFDRFGPDGGLWAARFRFDRTFDGIFSTVLTLLGGLAFCSDLETTGCELWAANECAYPAANGVRAVAIVEYVYMGSPGTITVEGHADLGNTTLDCDFAEDPWCVASIASHGFSGHFGVCMPPPEARAPDCQPIVTPVEDGSWGTIKSLYR